ncbi:MAG: hypothetical protein ABJG41_14165 [Cyclobacteriaceae bacterium]
MKSVITFLLGFGAGLAATYYVDPKGSQVKLKKIDKELKKNRKLLDKKLDEYKDMYNDVVDKYAKSSKEIIDNAKGAVDNAKKVAKA